MDNKTTQTIPVGFLRKYQDLVASKHEEFENSYYEIVDELIEKLRDMEVLTLPDLNMRHLTIIYDWENGDVSAEEVHSTLKKMSENFNKVATNKVTKRLSNYMFKADDAAIDIIKHTLAELNEKSLPLYEQYLKVVFGFFVKLREFENSTLPMTWITTRTSDNVVKKEIGEISLNQAIRYINSYIAPLQPATYIIGNNVVCFNEDDYHNENVKVVHMFFAPSNYVSFLKDFYKIRTIAPIKNELSYLEKIIGEYVK